MPLGIVTEDEFELELRKLRIPIVNPSDENPPAKIVDIEKGRGKGNVETPESLRALLGITSVTEGRREALEIARELGISNSSVSAYSHGATSTTTYNTGDKQLRGKINNVKLNMVQKATSRLDCTLDNITEDKLSEASLKELAIVGKSLSGIIKDLEPEKGGEAQSAQVVIYAPQLRQENHYETLELKE